MYDHVMLCTCIHVMYMLCIQRLSLKQIIYQLLVKHSNPSFAQLIFLRKGDCLGCAVLLCLDLACFFLPSFSSLFKTCIYAQKKCTCRNCEEEESARSFHLSHNMHMLILCVCVCVCVFVYRLINYMWVRVPPEAAHFF